MAVALRFGIVILQSEWTGGAAYVESDLNGSGKVTEARMLYFSLRYCCSEVYSARRKDFFQASKESIELIL